MCELQSTDELLNKAYKLAYFICGDKATAIKIATAAMAKQQVAAAAQDKRLYYKPGGRSLLDRLKPAGFRTKVSMNESHVLQRLVYIESEPYEKLKEQSKDSASIGQEGMIIHFIKHLVRITIKRNSFYVALGLSRLLHNYSTAETMEIYNVVVQDPDRVKDDYYYRSRKGRLMQEMKDRFGGLLKTMSLNRGEVRFQSHENSFLYAGLVRECLSYFCPWDTLCLLADGFDPISDVIRSLSFKSSDPDDEHEIEVNRMHAVIHPQCYGRLIDGLKLDQTDLRLEVPSFNMSNNADNENRPGSDRRNPPNLDEADLQAIRDSLAEEAANRKRAFAGLMRVLVDGNECARWDPAVDSSVRFGVGGDDELIEVRKDFEGREILLASHLLAFDKAGRGIKPSEVSVTLEGGQKFSFTISPSEQNSGEPNGSIVDIKYQEAATFKAFARRFDLGLSRANNLTGARALKPALALILLLLIAAATLYFFKDRIVSHKDNMVRNEAKQEDESNESKQPPAPSNAGVEPQEIAPLPHVAKPEFAKKPVAIRPKRRQESKRPSPDSFKNMLAMKGENWRSRGIEKISGVTSLSDVKKVLVELSGDSPANILVRDELIRQLRSTSRFSVTQNPDEADAMIKLSVDRRAANAEVMTIQVKLVNSDGNAIWPLEKRARYRKYEGSLKTVVNSFVNDLLADVRREQK